MDDLHQHPRVRAAVRTLAIVDVAMIAGVLVFAGIVLAGGRGMAEQQAAEPARTAMISYLAAGFSVMMMFAALGLPRLLVAASNRSGGDASGADLVTRGLSNYTVQNIVTIALLEGAALFNLVAFMMEVRLLSLAMTGLIVVLMAMQLPTVDRVVMWLARQNRV